jgi:multicomponent K+:H+ antiporter subunit E/multicomponent Na+:H+ antiporter subunit E
MPRVVAIVELLLQFVVQLIASGLTTAWAIVRPGAPPTAGLVRVRFANLDARGAALLGCMLTLTPGTTTVDVDMERGELMLHLLDVSQARDAVTGLRRFEASLRRVFPARGPTRRPT